MKHWIKSFCSFAFVVLLVSCHSKTEQLSMLIGHEDHYLQTGSCDFFRGRWVQDDSYPSYNSTSCPFIMKEFDCQKNGRPDTDYLKYRWKPRRCKLPRFNGLDFLRRFKGKRILFVGDSLSLNQWKSLTCMLHVSVPQTNYTLERKGALSTFTLQEYRISVALSRNGFLVDLVKEKMGAVLKLDSINNGNAWRGYDMLIFNTWHWWLHTERKQPWDYIQQGDRIHKDMDRLVAFKEGLTTWSNGKDWNSSKSTTCHEETKPLRSSTYPKGSPPAVAVVKSVLKKISTHVTLLDMTTLSQLRKDGHPSIYGFGGKRGNDCSHWCLPGVPDTWNQLLYATLITPRNSKNN
ncbi:hypothetical protein F2P56_020722 [Juglans regia]|uniref:Protein trichome birefringence-like 41 isoform X4 n=2 Tax=Juglans regia TaxID=51240 RepID=A0A2I4G9S3_JUGRE|nr:protein trichome birefringence-like 41 isoform X4 [Juglans regia]KAF5460886.1 hypothetical protein F2P56_020722 [Juglans regia]